MTKLLIHKFRSNIVGAALVEFSILLPVIFFTAFGMMEFGRALYQFHIANKGVKSAARFVARVPNPSLTCPPSGTSWTTAQTDAKTLAMRGSLNGSDPFLLSNWSDASSITIAVSCYDNSGGTYRGLDDLAIITVSTSFNFDDIGLLSTLGITGLTINASHQEMFIGG